MDGRVALPVVVSCSWGSEISLLVEGGDSDSFLGQLRNDRSTLVIAYGFDVALAQSESAVREVSNGLAKWRLTLRPTRTEFSNQMEMGSGSVTADQFAEMRARRILLDEYPVQESQGRSKIEQLNLVTDEVMVRGLNAIWPIEKSKFPPLFEAFKDNREEFMEIGWVVAVADLKTSSCVETIERLELSLSGNSMKVDFSGRRRRQYTNREPFLIVVNGELKLER
jgi:hypothetical protein